jgi:hypothetical protein
MPHSAVSAFALINALLACFTRFLAYLESAAQFAHSPSAKIVRIKPILEAYTYTKYN